MKKVLISVLLIITLIMSTMTTFAATPAKTANEVVIYVSPDGDDSASGTLNSPIATFEGAINKVRQMDKTKPVTVIFREGTYKVDSTIYMDVRDSGTKNAPITYKAYKGETPVFTTATKLDTADFELVTDAETLARLPEEGRGKVVKLDLNKYGVGKLGTIGWSESESNCPLNWIDVYLDGKTQMISQWPNGEMNYGTYVKTVVAGKTGRATANGGGSFQAETERIVRWQTADKEQMLLVGYWGQDYRHELNKIAKIDEETLEITLKYGTDFGVQCNKSKRWKVKNLLEEIDCPTEWYVDRNTNTLYYLPPYDLNGHEMYVAHNTFPLISFEQLSYVNFEGLKFFGAETAIYMGRENHHINITGNEFFGIQRNAIQMSQGGNYTAQEVNGKQRKSIGWGFTTQYNGSTYINIESNNFYDTGLSHLSLAVGDPYHLKDSYSRVHNNFFERASLITSRAGIYANNSMSLEVTNNSFHNMMFHAYNYGYIRSDTSYNHIWNVTREPYDAGAIYSGRDFIKRDNEIHHNIVHNTNSKGGTSSNGTNALYADDMLSDTHIYQNIMWDTGAGVHVNGANFCTVLDNTIIDCPRGSLTYTSSGETFNATMLLTLPDDQNDWVDYMEHVRDTHTYFFEEWPELYEELDYAKAALAKKGEGWLPYKSTISNNIANLPWSWSERIFDEPTLVAENNTLITSEMEAQFVDYKNKDYRLKSNSELAKSRPNALTEKNFDYKDTGVYISETRDSLPIFDKNNSPFRKLYPADGATDVDAQQAEFAWENAKGADQYIIRIATDPEMKNIVKEEICHNAHATFTDLEVGEKVYYWTVEAQNYSINYPSSWMSTDAPHLFTTSKYEKLKFETLNYTIEQISEKLPNLVEGEVGGGYPFGSKEKLETALAKANKYALMKDGEATQKEVNAVEEELKKVYEEVSKLVYSEERNLHFMFKDGKVDTTNWLSNGGGKVDTEGVVSFDEATKTVKLSFKGASTFAAPEKPGVGEINRFRLKITWPENCNNYIAIKHREQEIKQHNYSGNGYMIVVKPEQIEVQRRGSQSAIIKTVTNTALKNGQWADVAFGIVNTIAGVRYYFELNGTVIYDEVDTVLPEINPGYFSIYSAEGGINIEIQDNEEYKEAKLTNAVQNEAVEEAYQIKNVNVTEEMVTSSALWPFINGLAISEAPEGHQLLTPSGEASVRSANFKIGTSGKTDFYNMDLVLNPGDSYQALTIKNSNMEKHLYKANCYAVVFNKNQIEVQSFNNQTNQFLAIIPNNGLYTPGERFNIKFGAPNVKGGTRVVLYINDVAVCDVLDPNGILEDGEVALYDYAGGGIEVWPASSGSVVLDELYSDYYLNEGKIFNHNLTDTFLFANKATWKAVQIGADGTPLLSKEQLEAEKVSINFEAPYEYQHIYYWVGKSLNGDTNVTLRTKSSYDGEDRVFNIDNKNGVAGWIYLGAFQDTNSAFEVEITGSGKGEIVIGAFKMSEATINDKLATQMLKANGNSVVLNVGKQTAIINGQHSLLQAVPVVVNARTLVPIRFISEAFGYKVAWDGATCTATVIADGHTLKFTENQKTYYFDGVERTLDQPATVINNRMMLPIRVIAEDLGKKVYWEEANSGLIVVSNTEFNKNLILGGLDALKTYYKAIK